VAWPHELRSHGIAFVRAHAAFEDRASMSDAVGDYLRVAAILEPALNIPG